MTFSQPLSIYVTTIQFELLTNYLVDDVCEPEHSLDSHKFESHLSWGRYM